MNFTRFFEPPAAEAAAPKPRAHKAAATQESAAPRARKAAATQASAAPRARKAAAAQDAAQESAAPAPPAAPLPRAFAALLFSYDDLRAVAKSLERMRHVSLTVDNVCATARAARGAGLEARLRGALPRLAACCPGAVDVVDDDGGGGGVVVFPKLAPPPPRGTSHEAERRHRVEHALAAEVERQRQAAGGAWDPERAAPSARAFEDRAAAARAAAASRKRAEAAARDPTAFLDAIAEDERSPLVRALVGQDWYEGQIAHVETVPARAATFGALQSKLPAALAAATAGRRLWSHQALAVDAALGGHHVMLATGTASGKSLAFTLPAVAAALERRERSLFLFPTKALAQDQVASLRALLEPLGLACATLDGDTPRDDRATIAAAPPAVVVTNPDMIHATLLPGAGGEWRRLLEDVTSVVVDEAHVYVGAFGTHVAAVLRRLSRALGGAPRFFCCSATIANPREHAERLLPPGGGRDIVVVDGDGSPRGAKQVIVWNPPHKPRAEAAAAKRPRTSRDAWRMPAAAADGGAAAADDETAAYDSGGDETEAYDSDGAKALTGEEKLRRRAAGAERRALAAALGGAGAGAAFPKRRSSIVECAKLFAALVEGGTRTLAFGRTRKLVELVLGYAKERLEAGRAPELAGRVAAYRGGYRKEDRRRIERGLFGGGLAGVVATNALELGVDVGDLDATVHLGHPGSIASLWQQAGRAGRDANSTSAAIVVCWDSPIDQHFARRGGDVLARPVEPAALQVANESVLADQLVCAAAEAPLEARDRPFFALACGCSGGDCGAYDRAVALRRADGSLREAPGGGWAAASHAADHARAVSLRVVDPVTFSVKCGGAVVDEVPYSRAFYELYEGAVYLIQAAPHLVTRLDVMTHEATVKRLGACDYITSSPARDERATFPTSQAPISVGFRSFRPTLGRAVVPRNGVDARMAFSGPRARGTLTLKRHRASPAQVVAEPHGRRPGEGAAIEPRGPHGRRPRELQGLGLPQGLQEDAPDPEHARVLAAEPRVHDARDVDRRAEARARARLASSTRLRCERRRTM